MVEELLQFLNKQTQSFSTNLLKKQIYLVTEVDAKLFKSVKVKDLEARDIQDANEGDPLHLWVDECFVASVHQVAEQLLKQSTGDRRD